MTASAFDLTGRLALVTGATRGLGRAIAVGLADHGADIVVVARRQEACDAAASEIAAATGRSAIGIGCNVGNWDEIEGLVDVLDRSVGIPSILVNNAGIAPTYGSLDTVTEALFDKTVAVNLKGPFRLSVIVGTRLSHDGRPGSIVNISTTGAVHTRPGYVPYGAAKAGLHAMSVGLAHAFGPTVRVNTVMAGMFETDIAKAWDMDAATARASGFCMQRIGQPHDIVGTVQYLASDAAAYTTGSVVTVDGGEY